MTRYSRCKSQSQGYGHKGFADSLFQINSGFEFRATEVISIYETFFCVPSAITLAMDALLDQIKAKATTVNETGRRVILNKLRDLGYSIEAPEDTMQRILYQVSEVWKYLPAK